MSNDDEETKSRPYEVGRGKPPIQHQFKPKGDDQAGAPKRQRRRNGEAADTEQVDLTLVFAQPVVVTKGGRREKMDAYEATLSKQLERAIKDRHLPAITAVLDDAITFGLVKQPAPAPGGGVLLVPLRTAEALERYQATFFPVEDLTTYESEHGDE